MFIQNKIADAAKLMISQSLASHGVTTWAMASSFSTGSINGNDAPYVFVTCDKWEELYPELNTGIGKAILSIYTFAIKVDTTTTEFETVSDYVFNLFLDNNAITSMSLNAPTLIIKGIFDESMDVTTLNDGWMATQELEIVCGRLS